MKGISLPLFLPYALQIIVTPSVTRPPRSAAIGDATATPSTLTPPVVISPTAFPARESPMIATVGPITTAGISLLIQSTPTALTIAAIITYTRPAKIAPIMIPRYPRDTDTPPAKAATILPIKANDEPRKTGLFFCVKRI